jgi:predicted O-methyltransferase YrrM
MAAAVPFLQRTQVGMTIEPYSRDELWAEFHRPSGSIAKHLLVLYSLAVGLNAQRIVEIGVGSTTRTLRAATRVTGGVLLSCDKDSRFEALCGQSPGFEFHMTDSLSFLSKLEGPVDLALHDGAHDYWGTRRDLEALLPKMRLFGIVCVHDTQHSGYKEEMTRAIADAVRAHDASYVHLPYAYGMTLLRIEESDWPASEAAWEGGLRNKTLRIPNPMVPNAGESFAGKRYWLSRPAYELRRVYRPLKKVYQRFYGG